MPNFEASLLHDRNRERKLSEPQAALQKILVAANRNRAIQPKDFEYLYGAEAVKTNQEEVRRLEGIFAEETEQDTEKIGELFEALVNLLIEENDWLGPNATVIVPSRYDDIINGIDSIVEFEGKHEAKTHLALAMDVTENGSAIEKKLKRIRDSIDRNELSRVKYFQSGNFTGELNPVARVVVGIEGTTVEEIADLVLRLKKSQSATTEDRRSGNMSAAAEKTKAEFKRVREQIANHPAQRTVLSEIEEQLEIFHAYAESKKKEKAADEYARILSIIHAIIEEKSGSREAETKKDIPKDAIRETILAQAKELMG